MAVKVEPLMGRYAAEQRKRKASSPQLPASYEVKRQKDGHLDGDRKNSTVQSCCVVVDGRLTVNSLMSRGYLRPKARVALLPYFEELDTYVTAFYNYLITGAVTAVLVNEPYPGLYQFLSNLNRFVQNYGLRFTIPEAIRLIKFLHLVMTKPGQYREIIYLTARMLDVIIGMSRLTYRDMTLDWRPVFHLYYHAKYGKIEGVDAEKIQTAVYKLKRFYPLEESKLIWEELQVYLSPRNDDKKFFDLCLRFLPTQMNAEEHRQFGAGFWWDSLWKLYEVVEMGAIWGDDLPYLFAQVFHWAPDFRDISPIYEDLFIRILRSMQLVVRGGKIAVGDGTGTASILAFADLVGDLLGGPNSCQPLLSRLMKCLEAFMHPSNADEYSKAILVFMNRLCESVRDRVYEERIKKHKRPVPTEYYLKDEDITLFVESMLQTTLIAIYNEISFDKFSISKILMGLSALKPDLVIPRFLEHTYPALDAVCEPHRLLNTLECLVEVVYQIAADQSGRKFKDPLDHWVEQDSNVPDFYPFVSEHIKSQVSNELRTIRPHLIYLLEALTCAIDINDVAKTSISLQNMNLIFLLVPNIDCSSCIELRDDLTEDEKFLCQLTARLPALTDNILEKILDIIRSLSVCAPKNSTELLGGLKDETTATGEEEKNLRRAIDCCINALLCNSSPEITAKLIDKIFEFVACNEFDSAIATELATGVVAQAVFVRPENWPRFAQYVLKNLRSLLTPEVRRQKDLSSTALWFINLASALFCTTSEAFVRNKAMCFEFIELLTDCECKFAHDIGCQGMWYALYMLSRIYTIQQQILGDQFSRSLKDWVPIRDWGMTYQEHEISLAWHVPDESRRDVVAEILSRFMFPLLEKMRTTKVSVHDLRRYLKQVNMAYCGAVTCLPMPNSGKTDPLNISDRILPFARFSHAHVTNKYWDIPYIDGSNVRETLFVTLESLLENMTFTEGTEDTQALISITNMLRNIIDDKGIDAGERSSMTNQTDYIFSHLNDPMMNGKKLTVNAFDSYLYKIHLDYVCADESLFYYPFHRKVFDQLVKLALNDYPEVRDTARTELNHLVTVYYEARIDVVEKISLVFVDKNSSVEKIKAALDIVRDNKWISNCQITEKTMLWPALIKIPVGDRPTYNMAMDDMYAQLLKQNTVERDESESQELLDYTKEWWTEQPKTGLWEKFTTEEQIDWAREKRREAIVKLDSQKEKLVSTLIELFYDKSLHHTRIRLARAMLWKFQRSKANAATIKIILSKMLSDDVHIRDRCADELAYWMRKNKPKTKRIQWLCPERSSKYPDLLCGIREDNLCVAYDSKTLPNTAEKWQSCIFISKQSGCHKWPSTLSVPAPEPSLQRGPLCEAEKLIAIFFEHKENIDSTIELLILDKEETQGIDDNIFRVVKYVLRNFPDRPKILENFLAALKKMLSSRKHTEQRAAADIFCGVVKGTKHYPFETLNSMWKWLAPAIDRLIDHLNSEAETCWMSVFPMIFGREDPRRFFWLIEQILLGMQRPAPSAYHQAVRSGVLPAKNWRDVEIRKRITDIAWKQLPTATMEMQRVGISNALRVISTIEDANLFNDFAGLPERFRLRGTDYWLEKFMEKIESLVETPSSTKSEPQSSSAMEVELKQALSKVLNMAGEVDVAGMRSLLSESNLELLDEDEDRQGRIYLRCCLEFLLQYYEECMTCLTPGIVKLIPTLLEYSNDDESSDLATFKDHDIVTNSSVLIHDYMSGLLVNEKFADSLLHILIEAYERTCLWRAKVSVLKFFQVIVFSNVFTYERGARPQLVANLVYSALADEQIEVRQEAARCLETLIHFDYIKLDQDLLNRMENMLTQDCKWQQHGGILGYSAIVGAFPFSTPALVVPAIRTICQYSSRNAQIQVAATKVLREFRSSHRDNWTLTCKTLGPDLVYQIENVIAPVYYA